MKLIAVAAMVLSTTAVAQPDKDWWACQVVHSSGMQWENKRHWHLLRTPPTLISQLPAATQVTYAAVNTVRCTN